MFPLKTLKININSGILTNTTLRELYFITAATFSSEIKQIDAQWLATCLSNTNPDIVIDSQTPRLQSKGSYAAH